jgi:glycosyltransferase involved in cell wall biosynthesis
MLAELGIETDIVSTRRPPRAIASHAWAEGAERETDYLLPFTLGDICGVAAELLGAGPSAWMNCLEALARAEWVSPARAARLVGSIVAAGKLIRLARSRGWSHVHVHSCADAANVALFASILSDLSYSMTLHGPTLDLYGPNQAQKWKHAAFGIVVSRKLLGELSARLEGALPPVVFAPMGVDTDVIRRRRPYAPWTSGPCRIFSCGRLNPVKGHEDLIAAIALLRERGLDVRLKIAGEDEQGGSGHHRELERLVRERSLSDAVELLGAVSEERIREELDDAHVFALASLDEGISVAIMEAMAMEIPVVVTRVGGTPELVEPGVDGILVEAQQPAPLADALEGVLRNPDQARDLGQRARQKIVREFHHRRSAEAMQQCLARRASDSPGHPRSDRPPMVVGTR